MHQDGRSDGEDHAQTRSNFKHVGRSKHFHGCKYNLSHSTLYDEMTKLRFRACAWLGVLSNQSFPNLKDAANISRSK